jgi:hypothetical protein
MLNEAERHHRDAGVQHKQLADISAKRHCSEGFVWNVFWAEVFKAERSGRESLINVFIFAKKGIDKGGRNRARRERHDINAQSKSTKN